MGNKISLGIVVVCSLCAGLMLELIVLRPDQAGSMAWVALGLNILAVAWNSACVYRALK